MNHRHEVEVVDGMEPLSVGKEFPFSLEGYTFNNKFVVCSVSLYCKICIDLLPKLGNISQGFALLTDGTELDNEEIIKEFEYSFPVLSIEYDSFHNLIVETPSLMLVETDGNILEIVSIETIEEVNSFIEESR
ncbi:hypothetical protein ACQKOF_10280 [Lysinibacillus sp. NPDC093190]|uniref:hypothetical protein n=1 Tax=Lysinibacillus sp. NPDC093190 TaxID=3390575 RepID=UPI003CFD5F51